MFAFQLLRLLSDFLFGVSKYASFAKWSSFVGELGSQLPNGVRDKNNNPY
jgi:hypothetical protein